MKKSSSFKIDIAVTAVEVPLFALFRFCSPVFINGTQLASCYTLISKIVAAGVIGWYVLVYRKASVPFLLLMAFYGIRLCITLWYVPQNFMRVIMNAYPIMGLVCISEILLERNARLYIRGFAGILKILCIVNALQSLLMPNLFYQKYIIGGENQIVFSYIISVVLEKVYGEKKIKWYVMLLTLSIIRIFSAGNLLGWIIFLAIYYYYRKPRKIKSIAFFYAYCISWILIVIVRVQNVFAWLIVGILHKNLTLTNRTVIWDNALGSIKKRPLFGYGVQNTVNLFYTYIFRIGKPAVNSWFSAHNQVIQTLYESGIVSMIPIMLLSIIAFKRLDENRKNKMYPVVAAGIIGLSVSQMAEAPGWDSVFILLTLAYHIRKIPTAIDHDWEKMDD